MEKPLKKPWRPDLALPCGYSLGVSQSRAVRTILEQTNIGPVNLGDVFNGLYYKLIAPFEEIVYTLSRDTHLGFYRFLGENLENLLLRFGYTADVDLLGYVVVNSRTGEIIISNRTPKEL